VPVPPLRQNNLPLLKVGERMKESKEMLKCRAARPLRDTGAAWWYIDPKGIEVFAKHYETTTSVRLTAKQLRRALEIIESSEDSDIGR
jgi:hypothetical protein